MASRVENLEPLLAELDVGGPVELLFDAEASILDRPGRGSTLQGAPARVRGALSLDPIVFLGSYCVLVHGLRFGYQDFTGGLRANRFYGSCKADLSTYAILYVHGGVARLCHNFKDLCPGLRRHGRATQWLFGSRARTPCRWPPWIHSSKPPWQLLVDMWPSWCPSAALGRMSEAVEVLVKGSLQAMRGLREPFSLDTERIGAESSVKRQDVMISTAPKHPFFLEA